MSTTIASTLETFTTRLATLEHLLGQGAAHFGADADGWLTRRLAPDMHPLGTQVAFTCNQPRNFSLWATGSATADLDPQVESLATALRHIHDTRALLGKVPPDDGLLAAPKRLQLGSGLYVDLDGQQYLDEFLLPNFYFHLVTAYGILRMSGVAIGKRDYMLHLVPRVKQGDA